MQFSLFPHIIKPSTPYGVFYIYIKLQGQQNPQS